MIKNKATFYLLSFTWGIVMSIIGCLAALGLLIAGHKPEKWGYCLHFRLGKNWGGVNLGPVIITDVYSGDSSSIKNHEHGHALQNCKYGLFMIVVSIMSFIRYWYRELKYYRKNLIPPTAYDDAWYEGEATKLGDEFMAAFE